MRMHRSHSRRPAAKSDTSRTLAGTSVPSLSMPLRGLSIEILRERCDTVWFEGMIHRESRGEREKCR
jgi:hypothetical protein